MSDEKVFDEKKSILHKAEAAQAQGEAAAGSRLLPLRALQRRLGNRIFQRLLAQRSGSEPFELDDETAAGIQSQRGGGPPLDTAVQAQMGQAAGYDFSSVRVHTSPQADALSQQLNAVAFTTGQDVFFRGGAYQPGSSGGQELIAHELAHVVQQSSGQVPSGSGMTVNAPGDAFEQQADRFAGSLSGPPGAPGPMLEEEEAQIQRQEVNPDEEEEIDED